jgi:hypothetical protein
MMLDQRQHRQQCFQSENKSERFYFKSYGGGVKCFCHKNMQ